ncbi:hypothetical protein JXI42_13590 [bacterium]|nr:hypothetical protein [bacterium]
MNRSREFRHRMGVILLLELPIAMLSAILILAFLNTCNLEGSTLIFQSGRSLPLKLEGYDNFESFTIIDTSIDSGSSIKLTTDYDGFAIIKFFNSVQYPLIISQDTLSTYLHDPGEAPTVQNSPENEFMYGWLSTYVQSRSNLFTLEQELSTIDSLEPEYDQKEAEIRITQGQLEKQEELLSASGFQYAKPLLQARLLNESTYGIKTLDELNEKREAFEHFVNNNYDILQHSDMLMELIKQYFMMHEYVSYLEEGSEDIKGSKKLQYEYILSGVDDWVELLKGRIESREVVEFCAGLYYARSMVTQASRIFDHYRDEFLLNDTGVKKYLFERNEQFPDLAYVDAEMESRVKLAQLKGEKIIAVISGSSLFSKVETIILARTLEENSNNVPIIFIPVEKLSNDHLLLDKMFAGDLYFIHDEAWQKEYINKDTLVPQFILLSNDNNVIAVSNDFGYIIGVLNK